LTLVPFERTILAQMWEAFPQGSNFCSPLGPHFRFLGPAWHEFDRRNITERTVMLCWKMTFLAHKENHYEKAKCNPDRFHEQ